MSGRLVKMIGGPLDGMENHRELSTSIHERWVCYVAGHPTGKNAPVHIYEAHGSPSAPLIYKGIGERIHGDAPYPVSTYLQPTTPEASDA